MKLRKLVEQKDKIPEGGFHTNIENDTKENNNFRKVLFTSNNLQLVVMALKPNEDIGEETHSNTDQFVRIDEGDGKATIADKEYSLKDGDAIIIPAGSKHNVIAGSDGLKIYAIYTPPEHEDSTTHKTKKEAIRDEA